MPLAFVRDIMGSRCDPCHSRIYVEMLLRALRIVASQADLFSAAALEKNSFSWMSGVALILKTRHHFSLLRTQNSVFSLPVT